MKTYHIAFESDKQTQEKNLDLWLTIRDNGSFVKNEYTFDFIVSTYEYNNKHYELWYNDNNGYIDCVKEK